MAAAENIGQSKEADESVAEMLKRPFSKEIVEKYRKSKLMHISEDGTRFSFSFGVPLPGKS